MRTNTYLVIKEPQVCWVKAGRTKDPSPHHAGAGRAHDDCVSVLTDSRGHRPAICLVGLQVECGGGGGESRLSSRQTYTHTHTKRDRDRDKERHREREREREERERGEGG